MITKIEQQNIEMKNQAEEDLQLKLDLEKAFVIALASLFARIRREFTVTYARTGTIPNALKYVSSFTEVFKKQYARVQNKFKGRVVDNIDLLVQEEIDLLLIEWSDRTAPRQAAIVSNTTGKNFNQAVSAAQRDSLQQGASLSNRTIAIIASNILKTKFKARKESIAVYETQNSSEETKFIEADKALREPNKEPEKIWQTVGDKFVRETHNNANGQRKPISQPFIIGGFQMMRAGDSTRGAPPREFMF
jgi:hypothetical protein